MRNLLPKFQLGHEGAMRVTCYQWSMVAEKTSPKQIQCKLRKKQRRAKTIAMMSVYSLCSATSLFWPWQQSPMQKCCKHANLQSPLNIARTSSTRLSNDELGRSFSTARTMRLRRTVSSIRHLRWCANSGGGGVPGKKPDCMS